MQKDLEALLCSQEQDNNTENWSEPLTHDNFKATTDKYSIGEPLPCLLLIP